MKKHGMRGTREYNSWSSMKSRCYNPNVKTYKNYGGRGIKVCDSWLNSFEEFYKDMGPRPPQTNLDRIDNNKDYCKENCRWISDKEQHRNQRSNIKITFNDETMILMDWSKKLGIAYATLYNRLFNYNWSVEDAFTKPLK